MAETQVLHCACGAVREAPVGLPIVSCVQCGRAMAPASIKFHKPAPARSLVAASTLASQLLGTIAFALALGWIVSLHVTTPPVIGVLVAGALCVFAGGHAHRGSLVGLVICGLFDAAIAGLCLVRVAQAVGFVVVPLARLSSAVTPHIDLAILVLGAIAALAAVACFAALPQARRFAVWRGEQILHAARVRG